VGITQKTEDAIVGANAIVNRMDLHFKILESIENMPLMEADGRRDRGQNLYYHFFFKYIIESAASGQPLFEAIEQYSHVSAGKTGTENSAYRRGYKTGWKQHKAGQTLQSAMSSAQTSPHANDPEYIKGLEHGHGVRDATSATVARGEAAHAKVKATGGELAAMAPGSPEHQAKEDEHEAARSEHVAAHEHALQTVIAPHALEISKGYLSKEAKEVHDSPIAAWYQTFTNDDADNVSPVHSQLRASLNNADDAAADTANDEPTNAPQTPEEHKVYAAQMRHANSHKNHPADMPSTLVKGSSSRTLMTGVQRSSAGGGQRFGKTQRLGDFQATPSDEKGDRDDYGSDRSDDQGDSSGDDDSDTTPGDGPPAGGDEAPEASGADIEAPEERNLEGDDEEELQRSSPVLQRAISHERKAKERKDVDLRSGFDKELAQRIAAGETDDDDAHPEGGLKIFGPLSAAAAKAKGLEGKEFDPVGERGKGFVPGITKPKAITHAQAAATKVGHDSDQAQRITGDVADEDDDIDFNNTRDALVKNQIGPDEHPLDHLARVLKQVQVGPKSLAAFDKKQAERIRAGKEDAFDKHEGRIVPIGPEAIKAVQERGAQRLTTGEIKPEIASRISVGGSKRRGTTPAAGAETPATEDPAKDAGAEAPKTGRAARSFKAKASSAEQTPELEALAKRAEPIISGLSTKLEHPHAYGRWPDRHTDHEDHKDALGALAGQSHPKAGQPVSLNLQEIARHLLRNPAGMHGPGAGVQAMDAQGLRALPPNNPNPLEPGDADHLKKGNVYKYVTQFHKSFPTAMKSVKHALHRALGPDGVNDPTYMKYHAAGYKGESIDLLLTVLYEWLWDNTDMSDDQIETTMESFAGTLHESCLAPVSSINETASLFGDWVTDRPTVGPSIFDGLVEDDDDDAHDNDDGGEEMLGDQPMVDKGSADDGYADAKPKGKTESSIFDCLSRKSIFDGIVSS